MRAEGSQLQTLHTFHSTLYIMATALRSTLAQATRRTAASRPSSLINSISLTSQPFSTSARSSQANEETTASSSPSTHPPLRLSKEQREMLEEMIRVDQAGELGANWIYRGQYAVLGSDKKVGPLLQVSVAVLVAGGLSSHFRE